MASSETLEDRGVDALYGPSLTFARQDRGVAFFGRGEYRRERNERRGGWEGKPYVSLETRHLSD